MNDSEKVNILMGYDYKYEYTRKGPRVVDKIPVYGDPTAGKAYHITQKKNLESIFENGLTAHVGSRSASLDKRKRANEALEEAGVYYTPELSDIPSWKSRFYGEQLYDEFAVLSFEPSNFDVADIGCRESDANKDRWVRKNVPPELISLVNVKEIHSGKSVCLQELNDRYGSHMLNEEHLNKGGFAVSEQKLVEINVEQELSKPILQPAVPLEVIGCNKGSPKAIEIVTTKFRDAFTRDIKTEDIRLLETTVAKFLGFKLDEDPRNKPRQLIAGTLPYKFLNNQTGELSIADLSVLKRHDNVTCTELVRDLGYDCDFAKITALKNMDTVLKDVNYQGKVPQTMTFNQFKTLAMRLCSEQVQNQNLGDDVDRK